MTTRPLHGPYAVRFTRSPDDASARPLRLGLRLAATLTVLAALLLAPLRAGADGALTPLAIVSGNGRHAFQVEVAQTSEERSRGLMYRRSLAPDQGMLFDFGSDTHVSMWMRNTYIPLDMIFIRSDGVVHRVERDTTPFSERIIEAGAPVRFVVEVAAGTTRRLGIDRGDRVEHAIIKAK